MTHRAPALVSLLTPKSQVVWVSASGSVEQALERMRPNGYSAVPLLSDDGRYVGILSASDLLWYLSPPTPTPTSAPLMLVPRRMRDSAVHVESSLATLIRRTLDQSFVAVVDDETTFLGIVRRRSVLEYCLNVTPQLLTR